MEHVVGPWSTLRLGFVVVYHLHQEDWPLLDLHLRAIARCSPPGLHYRIYGTALRLAPQLVSRLHAVPELLLCSVPPTDLRGSQEHSYYLDHLTSLAVKDGMTHICTLDVDSFPIRPGWFEASLAAIQRQSAYVAILRRENGDSVLPHPSYTFFPHDFYELYRPTFFPHTAAMCPREGFLFRRWLRATKQVPDSGIGFAWTVAQHRLRWSPLLRSNRVDDHMVMGGIYGDHIFHLGALSRPLKSFRGDESRGLLSARQASDFAPPSVQDARVEAEVRNHQAFQRIRRSLLRDPDGYLAYLRYGP
jgi:hypothetical protein